MVKKQPFGGKKLQARVKAVKALMRGELLSAVAKNTGFDTKSLREWRKQFELGGIAPLAGITARDIDAETPYHFISYSRKDRTIAHPIFDQLRYGGVRIWVDELDIPRGVAWRAEIDDAIRNCDKFILLLSPSAVDSKEVIREVKVALDNNKELLPVKLRPLRVTPILDALISGSQILTLTNYRSQRAGLLLEALGENDIPELPPFQQMVFRENLNRITGKRLSSSCQISASVRSLSTGRWIPTGTVGPWLRSILRMAES